jgi:hypothetical protein
MKHPDKVPLNNLDCLGIDVPAGVFLQPSISVISFLFHFFEFHVVVKRESPWFLLMLSVK